MLNSKKNSNGVEKVLLGNEAIIHGALDSGVNFVSTFPGTPASEIGDIFFKIAKDNGIYFEYSINEKVAIEAAAGAAFSGLRSLCAMKHFGLNVAADSFLPLVYSGVQGAMVLIIADDPGSWSSAQSEQDTRYYAKMAHIPMLEPSCPSECYELTKLAFDLSDKFKIPVMLRTTTRVAHQSGLVKIQKPSPAKTLLRQNLSGQEFQTGIHKFSTMPPKVFEMKKRLFEKMDKIKDISEKTAANFKLEGSGNLGIIASGVSYDYTIDACKEFGINVPILKLGFTNPLPSRKISQFLKPLKKVLVIEELEPYIEEHVAALAKNANPKITILGENLIPKIGEVKTEDVIMAIAKILNKKTKIDYKKHKIDSEKINTTKRTPVLCPGCPYHTVFGAVKKAAPNAIFGGDIGCYMLSIYPPYQLQDWLISMGASVGIGHGVANSFKPQALDRKQKVISFIGDSTFFHAGIPALINCVVNNSNPLIIILDNSTTAMTGHQPHPGMKGIKIEDIVLASGVKNFKIVNSFDFREVETAVKEFLPKDDVSVIIARGECRLIKKS